MPVVEVGSPLAVGRDGQSELAPGVHGYAIDAGERGVYVPLAMADRPGTGDVGRFLDRLPKEKVFKFPNVINSKLKDMLFRRGFVLEYEYSKEFGEFVAVWTRPAATSGRGGKR